jgi:hypothetical protein
MERSGVKIPWWLRILCWLAVFFTGRSLNVWQVTKYGFMPLTFPFGDWIPVANRWLASIGDVMQLFGIVAIVLATLIRFGDERYARAGGRA